MLELYEQNWAIQSPHPNEVKGSNGGGTNHSAKTTSTPSENLVSVPQSKHNKNSVDRISDTGSAVWDHNMDRERKSSSHRNAEASSCSKSSLEQPIKDKSMDSRYSDAITKIDKDKMKAAIEKRRKLQNDASKKTNVIDEDNFIKRELENAVEVAIEDEKMKCKKQKQGFEEDAEGI